ncbi:YvcK family protein [Patescibacteria group bacterium]|nr:YvcK family protein [Patescibacteria group bacterium]
MNIVVIGGGTGSTVVLEGLKKYRELHLSVIVGMMDDGGSNAAVRDEFGLLPLSDVRKSILALSDDNDSNYLRKLLTYRFSDGENMKGHTLGNLLMIAMADILGSEIEAIDTLSQMFGVRGSVIPVTLDDVRLVAEYDDGSRIVGEHYIDEPEKDITITKFYLDKKAKAYPQAIKAIKEADYIILGPGDLYTTLLPNLLVEGIGKATKLSKGKIVYISNLMTKIGQTRHKSVKDIVKIIEGHIGRSIDYILLNNGRIPKEAFQRYIADGENLIKDDIEDTEGRTIVRKDLVANDDIKKEKGDTLKRSLVRHDAHKVGKALSRIFTKSPLGRFFRNIFGQYVD